MIGCWLGGKRERSYNPGGLLDYLQQWWLQCLQVLGWYSRWYRKVTIQKLICCVDMAANGGWKKEWWPKCGNYKRNLSSLKSWWFWVCVLLLGILHLKYLKHLKYNYMKCEKMKIKKILFSVSHRFSIHLFSPDCHSSVYQQIIDFEWTLVLFF